MDLHGLCVRACVCVCVRACVCACVCACACVCVVQSKHESNSAMYLCAHDKAFGTFQRIFIKIQIGESLSVCLS